MAVRYLCSSCIQRDIAGIVVGISSEQLFLTSARIQAVFQYPLRQGMILAGVLCIFSAASTEHRIFDTGSDLTKACEYLPD